MRIIRRLAEKSALKIMKRAVAGASRGAPEEMFQSVWVQLRSKPYYLWLLRTASPVSIAARPLNSLIYRQLEKELPKLTNGAPLLVGESLRKAVHGKHSFLVVQVHDGHYFLSKFLGGSSRQIARLASNSARYLEQCVWRGVDVSNMIVLEDDMLSLQRLRKLVKQNVIASCAIDYASAAGKRIYLNPSALDFASRINLPVYFAKTHISDRGAPELIASGPYVDASGAHLASLFIEFFNSNGDSRIAMTVKRYSEHTDWEKRRARLSA